MALIRVKFNGNIQQVPAFAKINPLETFNIAHSKQLLQTILLKKNSRKLMSQKLIQFKY